MKNLEPYTNHSDAPKWVNGVMIPAGETRLVEPQPVATAKIAPSPVIDPEADLKALISGNVNDSKTAIADAEPDTDTLHQLIALETEQENRSTLISWLHERILLNEEQSDEAS